jgi:hypothetical protein
MLANIQLSMDVFYQMNPSVKQDCSGISLGTYYCDSTLHIGLINPGDDDGVLTTTSSIPTSTAGPGEIVTPTPTQVRHFITRYKDNQSVYANSPRLEWYQTVTSSI